MEDPVGPPPGVRGRVQVAGSAPPMPINVQCNCAGSLFGLGFTDLRGGFYYPFYALPVSRYRLQFCDLRFYSPGYWPLILPFNDFLSESPYRMSNAGRLDLVPYGDISGTTISMTSLMAPKEAKKAFEKAVKKFVNRDYDDAVELLDEAVELHPEYAAAWTLLGQVRIAQRLMPAAEAAFQRSIEADPDYVAPYAPLTRLLLDRQQYEIADELSRKGLELNPYDVELKFARAVSAYRLKNYEDAGFYAQRIAETDDAAFYPDALFILARAVRAQGDYERAARLYGEYYANKRNSRNLRGIAGREMAEARLIEYTLRSMQLAIP